MIRAPTRRRWPRRRPAPRLRPRRGDPRSSRRRGARRPSRVRRELFVLDTNVLMHDPTSLYPFDEHDVYLPMITLEELDSHKRGMSEVARNARQVSRELDALAAAATRSGGDISAGLPLEATGHREAAGRLFFQTELLDVGAAARAAAGQGRQPDPRRRQGAVRAAARAAAQRRAGVERHQHAHQGACVGTARRGLLQRQDARRRRPAVHRCAAAAGRLLGAPRQDDGELAARRPNLLPHRRSAGAGAARSTSSSISRSPGAAPLYAQRRPRSPARRRC